MSVAEYDQAISSHFALQSGKIEGEVTPSDGKLPTTFDITEKQRLSGDRPIITPTSSVAQAKDSDNDFGAYALLVRRKVDSDGKHESTQLEIQNSIIQDALRAIMPECAYLNLAAHPITIQAPYYELFQYRKEIREYAEHSNRTNAQKSYLSLLLRFMSANLAKTEKIHSQYHPHWRSTYAILWTYFRPETFVVFQCEHYQELYRVRRCQYKQDTETKANYFELLVWSWDYNGKGFGPATTPLLLPEFQGARNLTEIDFFPLDCLPAHEKAAIIARLIKRGKRWRHLVHRSHQQYTGRSLKSLIPSDVTYMEPIGPGWVAPDPSAERRGGVTEKKDLVPVHVRNTLITSFKALH